LYLLEGIDIFKKQLNKKKLSGSVKKKHGKGKN